MELKNPFAKEKTELEKEYENAVKLLKANDPFSEDYEKQLEIVERLHKLLLEEKEQRKSVSPDAIVGMAAGLLQIGLILKHENLHNITSKAMSFVTKGRVR